MTSPAPTPKRQPIPFGKYLLLDRINIGGMAEVWRGKTFGAGGFERLMAIKRILPNIAEDEEFISMFIDEAKISVQLTHANVAQIAELGNIGGSYFIAMEYIPGKDLRAIFDKCRKKGEPAPIPLTCFVVSKMCEGLDYAHRKKDGMGRDMNIVHRDISPQNVLLSYEGEVKVIDFGIAKAAGKATKTQAGILKGKFGYMSPEQIRGLPLDRRSDVFAIGVVLYEMLTGERLFVGDSDFSVLEKVRKAEVLPPTTYNKRIPEALEKIVLKALAKEVDDRYQYANELGDDLQRFLITSDSIFSRKDLMQYMKSTFAEEVEREKQRLAEYSEVKAPEGFLAAIEMGYQGPMSGVPGAVAAANAPQGGPTPRQSATGIPAVRPSAVNNPAVPPARPSSANVPAVAPARASTSGAPAVAPAGAGNTGVKRSPSLTALPKLTAVAPLLSNAAEDDGGATMMADVNSFSADGQAKVNTGPMPAMVGDNETLFDPGADDHSTLPPSNPRLSANPGRTPAPGPNPMLDATLPPQPRRSGAAPAVARNVPVIDKVAPAAQSTAQLPAYQEKKNAPKPPPQLGGGSTNVKLYAAIGFAVVALLLVVGVVLFKGPSTGNLVLQVPNDAIGKVTVNIDAANVPWPLDETGKAMPIFIQRDLKAGPHVVIVSGEGFETWSGGADVKAGTDLTQVKVDMKRLAQKTQLIVIISPESAEIRINNEVVKKEGEGGNPFVGEAMTGQPATVEVRAKGYQKFSQKITPKAGETNSVKAALQPLQFALNVSSDPEGATIFVQGREVGTTPSSIKVAGGVSELVLKKNCFDTATVPLQLPTEPGDAQALKGALKKQPGCK
ncbi:MAG: protein kinase domain-containing protein [Myxococcaceae bacterium]